jgi:putative hemolysin
MLRGHCPAGGRRITGYATQAARYCAITGGEYTVTSMSAAPETGMCKLPSGIACDADSFHRGECGR